VDYVERGLLKPLLSATYPLKDLVQAQQDFKTRKHFGKLVMTM
jgi:NADPH:quinone reductase-like Zn-dependent oxidoreductase